MAGKAIGLSSQKMDADIFQIKFFIVLITYL